MQIITPCQYIPHCTIKITTNFITARYTKIKKRKKAEIEANKATIRAEDIAKGVFVPVSSLPQREPQKGAQIA